jgi:hypothetical protein
MEWRHKIQLDCKSAQNTGRRICAGNLQKLDYYCIFNLPKALFMLLDQPAAFPDRPVEEAAFLLPTTYQYAD